MIGIAWSFSHSPVSLLSVDWIDKTKPETALSYFFRFRFDSSSPSLSTAD